MSERKSKLEVSDSAITMPQPTDDKATETKMDSKLKIGINSSECIDYDEDKLFHAIMHFCYHNLKHIDPNDLPELYIDINSDYHGEIKHCGLFARKDRDELLIALSPKNIKEESNGGWSYNSPLKSLFHVFLHEFYHMVDLIESYMKKDKNINIGIIAEEGHKERCKLCKQLRRKGLNSTEAYLNLPTEQEADWFAFQNLSLFENLYERDFLYIPDDAFMAKVKTGEDDCELPGTSDEIK